MNFGSGIIFMCLHYKCVYLSHTWHVGLHLALANVGLCVILSHVCLLCHTCGSACSPRKCRSTTVACAHRSLCVALVHVVYVKPSQVQVYTHTKMSLLVQLHQNFTNIHFFSTFKREWYKGEITTKKLVL